MSIQYPAPGFEPTTFGMRVSSHNHYTRAPALVDIVTFLNLLLEPLSWLFLESLLVELLMLLESMLLLLLRKLTVKTL